MPLFVRSAAVLVSTLNLFFAVLVVAADDSAKMKKEESCIRSLMDHDTVPYLTMAFVVGICSVLLLITAIIVNRYVSKLLLTQLQEAEKNAHDVMDAILAVLIPESLLNEIEPVGDKKREKKKKK
uniref:Uncharacterized protein n=1 Tax=Ditylenchus dipsaci TaxID=166011 RepID=A0A915E899_9BILA